MTRWYKSLSRSLAVSSLLLFSLLGSTLGQSAPDRLEIRPLTNLREIEREKDKNVQRTYEQTDGELEWEIARRDQVLDSGNWLGTGKNSLARMWYNSLDVIYTQEQDTFSRFSPDRSCGFIVNSGKVLFEVINLLMRKFRNSSRS